MRGRWNLASFALLVAVCGLILWGCSRFSVESPAPPKPQEKVVENAQPREKEKQEVMEAARRYMEAQGLSVGQNPGEIVLKLENLWDGKAVVLYGLAASEFFAELGLRREADGWRVTYDQSRYFPYGDIEGPRRALAAAEGYVFGEEPGKYLLGEKELTDQRAILLVAPYGEPWQWEYTLEKKQNVWFIVGKRKAVEHWKPAA
jgi:hypothetical protein